VAQVYLVDSIKAHFDNKAVVKCDCALTWSSRWSYFDIFGMKEPDYVMMLMLTYGSLLVKDGQKLSIKNMSQTDRH
jgi:hypothetical protein